MSSRRSLLSLALTGVLTASVLASLAPLPAAHASIVEAIDFDTLVQEADDVVLARVIKQWTKYDDRGRIVTDFQMQVERVEKGNSTPGSAVIVRKLGGIIGQLGMRIAGEPDFTIGEEVLVFGVRGKNTFLRPVGMGQGTMRVFEQDGARWARSDAEGMMLVQPGDTNTKGRAAMPAPRLLDDVLADVRELVAAQRVQ